MAVVPQETTLAFDYSVLEIVLMGRYPHLAAFEVEGPGDLTAAHAALEATGAAAFAPRPFRTLSGGEKQRVMIASALAQLDNHGTAAPILLLDEPTASLDLRYQIEVAALLRRLHDHRQVTIVLTTHDLRFAASVCDDVMLLSKGRLLASGATDAILTPARIAELYEIDPALTADLVPAGAARDVTTRDSRGDA
jgi:iron complex transport system ATP-binding protein